MLRSFFKIALRTLVRNKFSSVLNISGLAIGMAVALLIGIWMAGEFSFNKNFSHYDSIAQVMQHFTTYGDKGTGMTIPFPIAQTLRQEYGSEFKNVTMASWNSKHTLTNGENRLSQYGTFFEPAALEMLDIDAGERNNPLSDPNSIILSKAAAEAVFGNSSPIGKIILLDSVPVKVAAVYADFPENSSFAGVSFIASWQLFASSQGFNQQADPWRCNCYLGYVQVADHADMNAISAKIKDLKLNKINPVELSSKPEVFLQPMSQWHLYEGFENGKPSGGHIKYVWLFGLIGAFVLLLACINFMNLSTAHAVKRAKEVGVRKAIGSGRGQLILQFFGESLLMSFSAFIIALVLVQFALPIFSELAGKKLQLPWSDPIFWLCGIGFAIFTGFIAGSYPALYLSSFQPVQVLKGKFIAVTNAALPRKVLVVLQFTVSVILIIGTIIVFRQIEFSKNRAVGYNREGLITIPVKSNGVHRYIDEIKNELIHNGTINSISEAGSPTTAVWSTNSGFDWRGKDPGLSVEFPNIDVSYDYGKTVGWKFTEGRDFSAMLKTDSASFVLNETAVKFMGLKNPVGEIIKWDGMPYKIIGVIKDMVVESPYEKVRPFLYHLSHDPGSVILARLSPSISVASGIDNLQKVFKKYDPRDPFEYQFVDDEYAKKFGDEQRIGNLAGIFASLAIFISCLGLFGMASFVAAQRTKEIGLRKVLGASVFNLWQLLSTQFVLLIGFSCLIAVPVAAYALHEWLQQYAYRTSMPWWIFAGACSGALLLTILTVSFHAIKASLANPVDSLRIE